MKTYEMVALAEKNNKTFQCGDMFYSKNTGFTDEEGELWESDAWSDNNRHRFGSGLYDFIHEDNWEETNHHIESKIKALTKRDIENILGHPIEIIG